MPSDSTFIRQALERFQLSADAWANRRKLGLEDLKFSAGQQWDSADEKDREEHARPTLTINRMAQFIRQVTNDQRQNRPAIKVAPVDSFSDPKTAEVFQGLIRHIEVFSGADAAYDTAFEHACKVGFGWWRITLEYENDNSFNRVPRIKRIRNPFMIYPDPFAEEPDYSDMNWAFVVSNLEKEEYKEKYPKSEMVTSQLINSTGDNMPPGWMTKTTVRVAEYFHVKKRKVKLLLVRDLEGRSIAVQEDKLPPGEWELVDERHIEEKTIRYSMINGVEELESTEWPGKWIPLVPCLGEEIDIDGEMHLVGMVRYGKDPAKMINYWTTHMTEQIALAPKPPWTIEVGQMEGLEHIWEEQNIRTLAALPYKSVSVQGHLVPPPQRNAIEPPIMAITRALLQAEDHLKGTMGLYNASLGARSNETSGKAIIARQREGDTSNFHLIDNLSRAIRHTGRMLVDLIPKEMPSESVARIIGNDEQEKSVRLGNEPGLPAYEKGASGADSIYNVGVGQYDVTVSAGPSFATKRQETVETMVQLAKAYPPLMELGGDILISNMDWPAADELAERLKKMLPPQLQEDGTGEEEIPPQVRAQMEALTQEREAMAAQLESLTQQLQTKQVEAQSREQIEMLKIESTERIEQMRAESQQAKIRGDILKSREKLLSAEDLQMFKAEFQREMSELQTRINALVEPKGPGATQQ